MSGLSAEETVVLVKPKAVRRGFRPESIAKMRAAKLGKKMSQATKEKLRIAATGRKHSLEARAKIALSKIGRKIGPSPRRIDLGGADYLKELFVEKRMFIREIAALHGVSARTVAERLRQFGIKLESRAGRQSGDIGPSYKGGIKLSRGYRFIAVQDDGRHKRDRDGYVAEHRIVASELIGRMLLPGEEVHHINFNKLDNRPDNLVVFGCGSDHTKFHKYLERVGAFASGLINARPKPVVLERKAYIRGEWVSVLDLIG
jgi:hypothetical protein